MKKYSLLEILGGVVILQEGSEVESHSISGIQIPMIQRDYAHGRKEEGEIRKRFLKSIFDALLIGKNPELDFIYGSIKPFGSGFCFLPLDGQQRLTTLLLLHWYIGTRELDYNEQVALRKLLKRFSYSTRKSATDFFEKLSEASVTFIGPPSSEFQNASWFFERFKNDPTVSSILVMLDAIHEDYEKLLLANSDLLLFPNLLKITFYVLPLEGFNLSDELYIKMNARGKQLTDFENFKADIVGWLKNEKNPFRPEFDKKIKFNGREMPYHLSFGIKLDTDWTNLFWFYTKDKQKEEDKIVDGYFFRFCNRHLLNNYIVSSSLAQDAFEKDLVFRTLYGKEEREKFLKYEGFEFYEPFFKVRGFIEATEMILDRLCQNYSEIIDAIRPSWEGKDSWKMFDPGINQRQRILLLGVFKYLEKNHFDLQKFQNWIRVLWNITIDPDIRSIPIMVSVMRLINTLSIGSGDIYAFLLTDECLGIIQNESSFIKRQLEEERKKAQLIFSNPAWEDELILSESHPLFRGNIGFLLQDNPSKMEFERRNKVAFQLFSSKGSSGEFNKDHLLIRGVIAGIRKWEELSNFNLGDNFDNWQLHLRRNLYVQTFIHKLACFPNAEDIISFLKDIITKDSTIIGWSTDSDTDKKARHIHNPLFQDVEFHMWIQDKQAFNMKWSNGHFYVHKPRSWYEWVSLNTYRNELIAECIKRFDLKTEDRCGKANYFKGSQVVLRKGYVSASLSILFGANGGLYFGIKEDSPFELPLTKILNDIEIEPGWKIRMKYEYFLVTSISDVQDLVGLIEDEVFNIQNPSSLVKQIQIA